MSYVSLGVVSETSQPFLKRGSSGGDVAAAQALLNSWRLSFGRPGLVINSLYDDAMVAAVEDFQKAYKIGVDGKMGPQTWSTLLNRKSPSGYAPPLPKSSSSSAKKSGTKKQSGTSNIPSDFYPLSTGSSATKSWVFPAVGVGAALLLFALKK